MTNKKKNCSEFLLSEDPSNSSIPELKLAPQYTQNILLKKKCTTIRKGRRKIKCGPLILSTEKDSILVCVTGVQYKKLSNLNESEAIDDGYESIQDLKQDLQKFYPNLKDSNFVTIIKFLPSLV